jgi:hypothetical protein
LLEELEELKEVDELDELFEFRFKNPPSSLF